MHVMFGTAVLAAGLILGIGITPTPQAARYKPTAEDKAFVWQEAAGPDDRQDASAAPLYHAIIDGDDDRVKALLQTTNAANRLLYPGRYSPLMVAAELNESEIVNTLLDNGADANYVAEGHYPTALDVALTYGVPRQDLTCYYAILNRGANINLRYDDDLDIAIHAATIGQMDVVNDLLKRGYRTDLPGLLETLQIRRVSEDRQAAKEAAMQSVRRLLKSS